MIILYIQLQEINSLKLKSDELDGLHYYDNDSDKIVSLKQLLVDNIGSLGENMVLNRAVVIKTDPRSYLLIYYGKILTRNGRRPCLENMALF